jgi:hypothetical protein
MRDPSYTPFAPRPPAPPPLLEHVATLFRVKGGSGRSMRCGLFRVATGHELRFEYEDREDLLRSHLFQVYDDVAIAAVADAWHRALIEKGFEELPLLTSAT